MVKDMRYMDYDEFAANLARVFETIVTSGETIVVKKEGTGSAVLRPAKLRRRRRLPVKTDADYEAFRSSAGSWQDVDTDKLIEDIYESRRRSVRPPVEL